MVAAHSPYSSNVILSPSFLFVFSRGRRGDLSETSYIAGAQSSRQMAALGASRPLLRTPANVSSPNRHRRFGSGRGNGFSCPVRATGEAVRNDGLGDSRPI